MYGFAQQGTTTRPVSACAHLRTRTRKYQCVTKRRERGGGGGSILLCSKAWRAHKHTRARTHAHTHAHTQGKVTSFRVHAHRKDTLLATATKKTALGGCLFLCLYIPNRLLSTLLLSTDSLRLFSSTRRWLLLGKWSCAGIEMLMCETVRSLDEPRSVSFFFRETRGRWRTLTDQSSRRSVRKARNVRRHVFVRRAVGRRLLFFCVCVCVCVFFLPRRRRRCRHSIQLERRLNLKARRSCPCWPSYYRRQPKWRVGTRDQRWRSAPSQVLTFLHGVDGVNRFSSSLSISVSSSRTVHRRSSKLKPSTRRIGEKKLLSRKRGDVFFVLMAVPSMSPSTFGILSLMITILFSVQMFFPVELDFLWNYS